MEPRRLLLEERARIDSTIEACGQEKAALESKIAKLLDDRGKITYALELIGAIDEELAKQAQASDAKSGLGRSGRAAAPDGAKSPHVRFPTAAILNGLLAKLPLLNSWTAPREVWEHCRAVEPGITKGGVCADLYKRSRANYAGPCPLVRRVRPGAKGGRRGAKQFRRQDISEGGHS